MRVDAQRVLPASRATVWAVVSDLAAAPQWLEGLARWEHAGGPTGGFGSRWTMRMRIGSADIGGLIEVVEWDEGLDIAWTSVLGIDQRVRIRLRDDIAGTRAVLRLTFQAPGGLLGRVAELVAGPMVTARLTRSLVALGLEAQRRELTAVTRRRRAVTRAPEPAPANDAAPAPSRARKSAAPPRRRGDAAPRGRGRARRD